MRILSLIFVLAFATTASAEPVKTPRKKYELVAFAGSLAGIFAAGTIAVRIANGDVTSNTKGYLGLAGIIALPSLGHGYAEDWAWVGIGVGSRFAALGVMTWGSNLEYRPKGCEPDFDNPCKRTKVGKNLITAGAAMFVASLVVELFHAPYSAHRYNQRQAITVTPTPMPGGGGVALAGTF